MSTTNIGPSRSLFWAILVLLVLGFVGLAIAFGTLAQRRLAITSQALERNQSLLRAKLDGLVYGVSEDLRKEAVKVRELGEEEVRSVLPDWRAILLANYAIDKIKLADEHGNEVVVMRVPDGILLRITSHDEDFGPPRSYALPEGGWTSIDSLPFTTDVAQDPRSKLWFSRALEDRRDEPIWSISPMPVDTVAALHLSYLIRSIDGSVPFRVMAFDYHPERSLQVISGLFKNHPFGILLMDAEGRVILDNGGGPGTAMREGMDGSRQEWLEKKHRRSMEVSVGDSLFHAVVHPYLLNGETLYTGIVVSDDAVRLWTIGEERMLLIASLFLAVLSVLLAWNHVRQRRQGMLMLEQKRMTSEQEQRLAKVISEREVLYREVHHRVKNNLQVVSSLLNLQTTRLEDGPLKDEFIRSKRRIDFMALVHHKLYGLQDLGGIGLEDFFQRLIASLSALYEPRSRTIITDVDTTSLDCDPDTAISLGIILCELVANSYQHAFPYASGGHVQVSVRQVDGDLMRLVVKDNGVGLDQGTSVSPSRMGMEVVSALAEQLDGSLHVHSNGGVTFEVLFRMQHKQGSSGR